MAENDASENFPAGYVPDRVWQWDQGASNVASAAKYNRPDSGAQFDAELPVGRHPLQLYSMGTPNGQKVTILLEELLAARHAGAEYDAWLIRIGEGQQFFSGFVAVNPNSKIPAMVDRSVEPGIRLFESGSILVYLAEKFGAFLPTEPRARAEVFNWLMWQMGSAPYVGGGFGHFYAYAPIKIRYAIDRFTMEAKRQLHVLDTALAERRYIAGDDYTIADMAILPWYGGLMNDQYGGAEFLNVAEYPHVRRWADELFAREPVARGRIVNRAMGPLDQQLRERHEASDFDTNRQDMIEARETAGA